MIKPGEVAIDPNAEVVKPAAPQSDMRIIGKKISFTREREVDAEGQRAAIDFETQAAAGMGLQNRGELGQLPTVVRYETTAGEMADGARSACTACRFWNQKAWYAFVQKSTGPLSTAQDRDTIEGTKKRLALAYGPEGVQTAMESMGICNALSEVIKGWVGENPIHWPVVTKDDANCPSYVQAGQSSLGIPNRLEVVTPAAPFGLFKAKDLDAVKIGDLRRDGILFDAANKTR